MRIPLKRRTFLRGAGVAIALPMLEAMAPLVKAVSESSMPIKRFVCLSSNYGVYREGFFAKLIERNKMTQMAHLVDLLKAEEDTINGGTLRDHTTILWGCGMATGPHSTKNLPLILAGGGFMHGEHMVYPEEDSKRIPAANLLLSILQNLGLEIDRFGTCDATLRGLECS